MSGLEAISITASLIQIADLGANLSIRLFTFYRQMKTVNKSIQNLSSDVALTSTIMRQLAENLRQDEQGDSQTRLCSSEAFQTAEEILGQCRGVFDEIESTIEKSEPAGSGKRNGWKDIAGRARNALLEPDFNVLMGNLERLKSSMLLLLNVILYAGQVRSKSEQATILEQRELIQRLMSESKTYEDASTDAPSIMNIDQSVTTCETLYTANNVVDNSSSAADSEIKNYNALIKKLLFEIDARRLQLENSRYVRIKDGVQNIHSGEIVRFQLSHGCSITEFDQSLFEKKSDAPSIEYLIEGGATQSGADFSSFDPTSSYDYRAENPLSSQIPTMIPNIEFLAPSLEQPGSSSSNDDARNFTDDETASERLPSLQNALMSRTREEDPASVLLQSIVPTTPDRDDLEFSLPSAESEPEVDLNGPKDELIMSEPEESKLSCAWRPSSAIDKATLGTCVSQHDRRTAKSHSSSPKEENLRPPPPYSSRADQTIVELLPLAPDDRTQRSVSSEMYKCHHPGCTAPPFQTQYLLNSHANVHAQKPLHFCPIEGCPRGVGGRGFKRRNELIRHGLIHDSPGYVCPFCSDQQRKYPRPDNLQRHVRVHHIDKSQDDPALQAVFAQSPSWSTRARRRRINDNSQRHDNDKSKSIPQSSGRNDLSGRETDLLFPTNQWEDLLLKWTTLRSDEIIDPSQPATSVEILVGNS